jgi:hypothetical protein
MNESYHDSGFDSRDCVNVFIDGPGDPTGGPIPERVRAFLIAERERLRRLGALDEPNPPADQTKNGSDGDAKDQA